MVENNITFEGCRIIFRNFTGKQTQYNPAGKRNFCVVIPTDQVIGEDEDGEPIFLVNQLLDDGWNVKIRPPRDENDSELAYLQVAVSFDNIPPKIWMISSNTRTLLDETTVGQLDFAEIVNVDLIVRPYNWEVNGKSGVKAYVKAMYVTIEEDEFAAKYFGDDDLPF